MAHGGKREGSGRKPVKHKAQSRVMRVPEPIAPTIKRVIDALKNNPDLEDSILNTIYTHGHALQLHEMKKNITPAEPVNHWEGEYQCQSITTSGKRCRKAGKQVIMLNDGEYLACNQHYESGFKPINKTEEVKQ